TLITLITSQDFLQNDFPTGGSIFRRPYDVPLKNFVTFTKLLPSFTKLYQALAVGTSQDYLQNDFPTDGSIFRRPYDGPYEKLGNFYQASTKLYQALPSFGCWHLSGLSPE